VKLIGYKQGEQLQTAGSLWFFKTTFW